LSGRTIGIAYTFDTDITGETGIIAFTTMASIFLKVITAVEFASSTRCESGGANTFAFGADFIFGTDFILSLVIVIYCAIAIIINTITALFCGQLLTLTWSPFAIFTGLDTRFTGIGGFNFD
jgi:hypothetical protein